MTTKKHARIFAKFKCLLKDNDPKTQRTYDINIVKRYFISINETREIEAIPAKELNILVSKFFMNVRKKNGRVYEPFILSDFQRILQ